MKKWEYTVELGDLHKQYQEGNIQILDVATELSERLKQLPQHLLDDWTLQDVIECLPDIENVNEYDSWLKELYDWADKNNVWINSFS